VCVGNGLDQIVQGIGVMMCRVWVAVWCSGNGREWGVWYGLAEYGCIVEKKSKEVAKTPLFCKFLDFYYFFIFRFFFEIFKEN